MAKPTRFTFGIALGFENQFFNYGKDNAGSQNTPLLAGQQMTGNTAGLLAQASTGPDTSLGSLFYTNNTGATVISLLRHAEMGKGTQNTIIAQQSRVSPPPEGKLIRIMFLDGNTSFAQGGSGGIGNIVLATSDGRAGTNNITDFMASNGTWYQVGASNPSTGMTIATFTGAGSSSINVNNVMTEIFAGTAATQLVSISGGYIGQSVALLQNTAGITLTISTNGNIIIAGTNAIVAPNGSNYTFTRFGSSWFLDRGAV